MITLPVWALLLLTIVVIGIVVFIAFAVSTANRLNRLHIRTDSARLNLEGALAARSSVIAALQPDLAAGAHRASQVPLRANDMGRRSDAENALLTRLAPTVLEKSAFIEVSTRVDLAARFYNEAVGATLSVRLRPFVRAFRLAGRAPLPEYYEALSAGSPDGQK